MSANGMKYDIAPDVKTCKHCGETKDLTAFAKVPKSKDGRGWRCYACANAVRRATATDEKRDKTAARARRWKQRNQDKVKARRAVDRERNRQRREHINRAMMERRLAWQQARDAELAEAKAAEYAAKAAFRAEKGAIAISKRDIARAVRNMDAMVRRDIRRYIAIPLVVPGGAYVYLVTVDHIIRYIGKGKGDRAWSHINTAIRENHYIKHKIWKRTTSLYRQLYDAITSKQDVRFNIVRDGISDHDAFRLESRLIDTIRPMGILWNTANGRA